MRQSCAKHGKSSAGAHRVVWSGPQIVQALSSLQWGAVVLYPVRMATAQAHTRLSLGPGDGATWVYLVEEGLLRPVAITPEGRECGLGLVGPGEALLHSDIDGQPAIGLYIEALQDSRCLCVPRDALPAVSLRDPELAGRLLIALAGRVADLGMLSASLVLDGAGDRLLRLLQQLALRHGTPDAGKLRLRLRQQDLASLAGVCRETVNATLRDLAARGLVRCGRQTVWLTPECAR